MINTIAHAFAHPRLCAFKQAYSQSIQPRVSNQQAQRGLSTCALKRQSPTSVRTKRPNRYQTSAGGALRAWGEPKNRHPGLSKKHPRRKAALQREWGQAANTIPTQYHSQLDMLAFRHVFIESVGSNWKPQGKVGTPFTTQSSYRCGHPKADKEKRGRRE